MKREEDRKKERKKVKITSENIRKTQSNEQTCQGSNHFILNG